MHLAAGPLLQLGGRVGVDAVDDVGDPERAVLQHLEDLPLTRPAMLQVLVDLRLGLVDDVAVAGRDARHPALLELLERRDVLGHVAPASGVHDREGAVEDDVAGEQDALLLEQEADVVGRVTGSVDDLEPELGAFDAVAIADGAVGRDDRVALREGDDLGAGRLHQPLGAGRVVGMGVREEHPADALAHRRADDGVDVLLRVEIYIRQARESVGPGFGATMRRTSGDSALGTPGVMSGIRPPPRSPGRRGGGCAPRPRRRRRAARTR